MIRTTDRWTVADEWFAEFIRTLEASPFRVACLRREARRGVPAAELRARDFEEQTEQFRRFLAGQEVARVG